MYPRSKLIWRIALLCVFVGAGASPALFAKSKRRIYTKPHPKPAYKKKKYKIKSSPRAISALGEKMVMRIDRLIKKKSFELMGDPWTVQGIPIVFPTRHEGFHLGAHISLYNIRRQDPHKLKISGQVLASDRGRMRHYLHVDAPHAFSGAFRIRGKVSLNRDITRRYFGISNTTQVDESLISNNADFYKNTRLQPRLDVEILKRFGKYLQIGPVFGIASTSVSFPTGSLLDMERPSGVGGGRTNYIGAAVVWDRTDFEPYPSRGNVHELYLTLYNQLYGSDFNFFRGNYTFKKYWPLSRKLTLAHRSFLEVLSGNVPFYELGATGGKNPSLGFGQAKYLRGFHENQFIGDVKFASGLELRWDPLTFYIKRQRITVGFVPVFDVARVWNENESFNLGPMHASVGLGLRSIWSYRLILRMDFAMSAQGTMLQVELGNFF